jgi:hypothetical protein
MVAVGAEVSLFGFVVLVFLLAVVVGAGLSAF